MTPQTMLYFSSILLTCILTGFLAWYAWKHQQVPASRAYMRLTLSEYFFALAEILSVISPSSTTALFWFQVRYIAGAFMGVLWLVFALEYGGHREWLSKRLLAGLFVIPFVTQVLLWSNSLHELWMKQEAVLYRNGALWIADVTTRIPGLGYLTHSFYTLLLTLAGIALMLLTAWKMRRELLMQALMLAGAGLTAFTFAMNSLFNFLPKIGFNPFTPGIGLSVLLIALSVFRFEFLKRAPAQKSDSRTTRLDAQEKYSLVIFILIFILFTSSLAAASTLTYQNYEKQFRAQVESQLSAIAELKVNELVNWRAERMADAQAFHRNPAFAALAQRSLEHPDDLQTKEQLQAWLDTIRNSYDYERIFLLDTAGVERVSSPATPEPVAAHLTQESAAIIRSDQIIFLDLHRDSPNGTIHLALLVPIYAEGDQSRPLGLLVLRIDPEIYLYPFLQQWPAPSQSAETLLIRREGEDALFLNPTRFKPDSALELRIPLENTETLAVKAALGQEGVVQGVDYRGVEVIGDVRSVPSSPWFLVARMDVAEVYAPLRERLWQTILFFGVLVLASGAGLALVWRQGQVSNYRAQVKAAEALRSSEEKFRLAFDTSPDSVAITRLSDGMFVSVNKGFEQISGYTREQALGKTSAEINIWKDPEDRRKVVEGLRATGEVRDYEAPFLTRSGEIYGMMSAVIIQLNGEPHILNITRDITERKRAEEELRESEGRFRRSVLGAPFPIMIHAEDGEVVTINTPWTELTGYNHSEIPTIADWTQKAYGARMDLVQADIDSLYALDGPKAEGEYTIMTSGGQTRVWDFSSAPIGQLPDGRRLVISMAMDVTERVQAEEQIRILNAELEQRVIERTAQLLTANTQLESELAERERAQEALLESEERFRRLSEAAFEAIIIHDGGILLSANNQYCEMFGYELEELFEKQVMPLTIAPDSIETVQKEIAAGGMGPYEAIGQKKDGTRFPMEIRVRMIEYKGRKARVAAIMDITERKRTMEALLQRTAQLEAAQEQLVRQERLAMLGQLAGSIGHELRNPLGVISNAVYFLKMSQPDANNIVKEYLDIIESETRTSDKIVTDLLDFTRIKSLDREPASVSELIRQTLERYPVPPSVKVVLEIPADLPRVYADPQHIIQVLGNLTVNACQAMDNTGNLSLSASIQGDMIIIEVQDTGMGIPIENMSKVFEPLYTTKTKGIGLGLAVSRKLAEANGGRIEVQSEPNKGSTFTLYLPVYKE